MDELRTSGVRFMEPIEGQPMVVAELSDGQLDHMVKTGLVDQIFDDQPLPPQ